MANEQKTIIPVHNSPLINLSPTKVILPAKTHLFVHSSHHTRPPSHHEKWLEKDFKGIYESINRFHIDKLIKSLQMQHISSNTRQFSYTSSKLMSSSIVLQCQLINMMIKFRSTRFQLVTNYPRSYMHACTTYKQLIST